MGTRFTVGGVDLQVLDYSVVEDSTGLSLNDSSGGTGEVRVSVAKPSSEEIRDFPVPYPESRSLTPVVPAYYGDLSDLVYTPEYPGYGQASYSTVDISESFLGVRRAIRVSVPPGTQALLLPNGGARILRSSDSGGRSTFSQDGLKLPPVRGLDPQTGKTIQVAASVIPRQIPSSGTIGTRLALGWPSNLDLRSLGSFSVGVEYGAWSSEYDPEFGSSVAPALWVENGSAASSTLVVDIVTLGAFSAPSTRSSSWDILFTGFKNPPGYVTSWDSGSPQGLASRYEAAPSSVTPWLRSLAPEIFEGLNFTLEDSRYGRIPGRIDSVSETDDTWEFTCISTLGLLNSRNVELPPVEATASQILRDYVRAGGVPWVPIYVEPELDSEVLRLPRREGDLWVLLKQFAAGLNAEISVVDGVVILRRPRRLVTEPGRYFSRSVDSSNQDPKPGVILQTETLAPSESEETLGVNVYPQGFINQTLPVIAVAGGETSEVEVTLSSEVGDLFVPRHEDVYRKVAVYDDLNAWVGDFYLNVGFEGSRVTPTALLAQQIWLGNGWYRNYYGFTSADWSPLFSLSIQRVPTSERTVLVTFKAPKVVDSDGRSRTFSLASISGGAQVNGLNLYSTWAMQAGPLTDSTFPTGSRASKEDALDLLSSQNVSWTPDRISSVGYAAARRASGRYRTLSGSVDRLRPPYESNYYSSAPYSEAALFVGSRSYDDVPGAYSDVVNPVNYVEVQRYWDQNYESSIKSWIFGNVSGSRVWDEASNNFYRIRSATITPAGISISAETDTVHGDVDPKYQAENLTYADVTTRTRNYLPLSYEQASASGYLKDPANA